ncbi:alkaline phosphatase [Aureimonas sp. Leaf460]|uniref:esterase-like activity of phytase family protein n=1 Tax=Aureimonas sp. Leaf460 TaxID=1736384 RepID=UPI0006FC6A8A|nr:MULTISPECIES: esterase-like activity of phytase family protein [unclassified Aureimonas]KQT62608.1 alkaline phosphatase [Aureimonas sp. Leaf427]KQT73214.1 alkaline phosphatase [Aureimonas sp. Leaf460]
MPLAALFLTGSALGATAEPVFNRIASFAVTDNLPADKKPTSTSSAEIVAASEDGLTLIYSDSPLGGIGLIDISDARSPKAVGFVDMKGEPTSVAVIGGTAIVAVNTSENRANPSGRLATVDLASKAEGASCDLGGQPDSVAVSPDKTLIAVAIENERDEDVAEGALPQLPAGDLVILSVKDGAPDCASLKRVDLTGLAEVAPEDPEPEFVAFNGAGEIAVTLQENNHIAIVDAKTGKVTANFSAGTVALEGVDAKDDKKIAFTDTIEARPREPDAVKWLGTDRLVVANEGDWKGGTRGFTIFKRDGTVAYESGLALEMEAAKAGHYPDKRSDAKGVEPEGLEVARFGDETLIFILAERGSVVGVYRDTGAEPAFLQLLPSGISPEGAVALPGRNLLVTANEADLGEDGAARSHVMIYERAEGTAAYPELVSDEKDGRPIAWGALSGIVADPKVATSLRAVSDSAYAAAPTIYAIDASKTPARITSSTIVTRNGKPAEKLDLEGIAHDGAGGFWLASEGDTKKDVPHQLVHVDAKGAILEEVPFDAELLKGETRSGSEGITMVDGKLWIAIQRPWKTDPKNETKLVSYDPATKAWSAVLYPLETAEGEDGWVGLSEITAYGDHVYLIERDNRIGQAARLKAITRVALSELNPAPLGGPLPVVAKETVRDLIPNLKRTGGYVVDKVEGFAIGADSIGHVVTDNDGVDDSSGETLFFDIGNIRE